MSDVKVFGKLIATILIVAATAILWLYLLEEMGFGTWECWPS